MLKLYEHQSEAFEVAKQRITDSPDDARGRIVIPTGGGKTLLEATILDYVINNNSSTGIHLVLAPRIMLGNQLLSEFKGFLGNTAFRAMAFHSGEHIAEDSIPWKETATTNPQDILDAYANAQKLNQPLVIFSTYHSCGKLDQILFDTIIADESQYCTAEGFNKSFANLQGRVRVACTATERHTASNSGFGLNNEELFGSLWYYIAPAKLIERGLIVPPRLHILHAEAEEEHTSIVHQVKEIADAQVGLTTETLEFSKILFAMAGTADVKVIEDSVKELREEFPEHDVFTITSKSGAMINGNLVKRKDFMEVLKDCENALIFHYDILSEGIDVDGITGVGIMRNMGLAKLLQTIGRAVRLYKPDPSKKQQAWISVPVINANEDDKARVLEIIRAMRMGGFDISKEDIYETKADRHESEDDDMEDAFDTSTGLFSHTLIEDIFHEIEDDEFWYKLAERETLDEKLDMFFEEA
jgi:superfamily II DNA or RNA helicase